MILLTLSVVHLCLIIFQASSAGFKLSIVLRTISLADNGQCVVQTFLESVLSFSVLLLLSLSGQCPD